MYSHNYVFLPGVFLFLLLFSNCLCYADNEADRTIITDEIKLNIPQRDTIRITKVPRGIILSIAQQEFFEDNSTVISRNGKSLLKEIARLLDSFNNNCTIEAHTEEHYLINGLISDCDWEYSIIRANRIAEYLVKNNGIKSSRLFPIGFGYIMPFKDNVSENNFYNNRIDFVIFDYTAIR